MSGHDHKIDLRSCCTAAWRLFGITPAITLSLIFGIAASTIFHGWMTQGPVRFWHHTKAELILFCLEVLSLLISYLTAVLRGPGFVPFGWEPTKQELSDLRADSELPLNVEEIPVEDLLQWCASCQGYKPPRAHHCSTCRRCVLSMDHHCPWTNTCIGQINLKAFVQFVHFVPVATLHSFLLHSELLLLLAIAWQRARRSNDFFKVLLQLHVLLGLIAWFAALAVMLLVGTLAWEMQHTVRSNMTMIEEYILEKAELRRRRNGEKRFVFPYDLGKKSNTAAIMGSGCSWLLLGGCTPGEPVWPRLRPGSCHFEISTEQIAQKAEKLQRSMIMPVRQAFAGEGWCCLTYWCWVAFHFGCAVCDCEACGEARLTVTVGQAVLVSKSEGSWAHGRLNAGVPQGPGGWLPRHCLNDRAIQPYQVPFQKELQGCWEVESVSIVVKGLVVHTAASRLPFVLREADETVRLLGILLNSCDGKVACWSNGQVWKKAQATSQEWPEEDFDLPPLEEMKKDA